jgi:hypothetical protein
MNPGDIFPTDRITSSGRRVIISIGADGLGRPTYSLEERWPEDSASPGAHTSLEPPRGSAGLFWPPKGTPYFTTLPDARRAVEAHFPAKFIPHTCGRECNRLLDEIDAWRSGGKGTPGRPSAGERYALDMREHVKAHVLELRKLGHHVPTDLG